MPSWCWNQSIELLNYVINSNSFNSNSLSFLYFLLDFTLWWRKKKAIRRRVPHPHRGQTREGEVGTIETDEQVFQQPTTTWLVCVEPHQLDSTCPAIHSVTVYDNNICPIETRPSTTELNQPTELFPLDRIIALIQSNGWTIWRTDKDGFFSFS